ncbi:MAG: flagellar assembly protein FliH [Alphaproteobacteria bacterium]|nr:flagellar assembly protein FliH [Alphaproteobacteria bacterium]
MSAERTKDAGVAQVRKFLFDLSFDQAPVKQAPKQEDTQYEEEPEPEAPPPPVFSEEELLQAKEESYAQGREDGLKEAEESRSWQESNALRAISEQLAGLFAAEKRSAEVNQRAAIQVAQAMLRKLAPSLARKEGLSDIESLMRECMMRLGKEPRVVVRVTEELAEAVRAKVDGLVIESGFEGRVVVIGTPGLDVTDCKVEWADGGAERDLTRLIEEVDAVVEKYLIPEGDDAVSEDV